MSVVLCLPCVADWESVRDGLGSGGCLESGNRASVYDAIEQVSDCGRSPLGVGAVARRREWWTGLEETVLLKGPALAWEPRERAGPPLYHCASHVLRWPLGLTYSAIAVRLVMSLTGQGGSGRRDSHNLSVDT